MSISRLCSLLLKIYLYFQTGIFFQAILKLKPCRDNLDTSLIVFFAGKEQNLGYNKMCSSFAIRAWKLGKFDFVYRFFFGTVIIFRCITDAFIISDISFNILNRKKGIRLFNSFSKNIFINLNKYLRVSTIVCNYIKIFY